MYVCMYVSIYLYIYIYRFMMQSSEAGFWTPCNPIVHINTFLQSRLLQLINIHLIADMSLKNY